MHKGNKFTNLDSFFADGACEGEDTKVGSLGAVLISPSGIAVKFISDRVPDQWMAKLLSFPTYPNIELELLTVWIALVEWEGHF